MKNTIMITVVVLSFVDFSTLSFAGMTKPPKPGEIRPTGLSIYKTPRPQAVVLQPATVFKAEITTSENEKLNEKK